MSSFSFTSLEFTTKTKDALAYEEITCTQSGEISKFSLDIDFGKEIMPSEYVITWKIPQIDTLAFWSPRHHFDIYLKPDWEKNRSRSSLASGMPVCALVSKKGENRLTAYVDELKLPVYLTAGVVEETAELVCEIKLFSEPTAKISKYHTEFTARLNAEKLNLPLEKIDLIKCHFEF